MATRDETRDIIRGLTALEMVLINASTLRIFSHSSHIGFTYADTIFPTFAFLAGMSRSKTPRDLKLIGLGIVLNFILVFVEMRSDGIRIPGVLQRLGIASILAHRYTASSLYAAILVFIIWTALSFYLAENMMSPFTKFSETAQTRIDHAVFGRHIYGRDGDPEGLLGCLTTSITIAIGKWIHQARLHSSTLFLIAASMITISTASHLMMPRFTPISKELWTPPFIFVSAGYTILKSMLVKAVKPYIPSKLRLLLRSMGQRSIEVYLISTLLALALRHAYRGASMWVRMVSVVEGFVGGSGADFLVSLSFALGVGVLAVGLVKSDVKVRI